jgi:hypothetical protein
MKLESKNNPSHQKAPKPHNSRRAGERGAALITTLLVSVLLLGAGGALIMTTMMSATNSLNSTPEMQAYYLAESGMQSALNVLRGNVKPSVTATDRMSFRTAIIPSISNGPGNAGSLRLAQWLPYNQPSDPASLVPITVGTITGGYRVTVENMDPNSHIVQYQTSGVIDGSAAGTSFQKTFGTTGGTDEVIIRYAGQVSTTLTPDPNNFPLTLDSLLGSFVIDRPITSTADDVVIPKTGFELTISQTSPWAATAYLEGTFEGEVDTTSTTVKVTFDKASVRADGTTFSLDLGGTKILNLGFTGGSGSTTIPVKVTSPDPRRLLLKSYGFGPLGSEKRLEMMVNKVYFDFESPAGVTIRGADDCSPLSLDTGSSGAKWYSGVDASGVEPQRPAFAVTPCDKEDAEAGIKKHDTVVDPEIGLLGDDESTPGTVDTPSFLDTADRARAYLNGLQSKAQTLNRYFKPSSGSAMTVQDSINSGQFTFVDGDCTLKSGAGILVVTGTLEMKGDTDFRGIVLVLGQGVLIRRGGGDGSILGGITIAAFGRTAGGFTPPTFHTDGGGNSTVQYASAALNMAMGSGSNVAGIREF